MIGPKRLVFARYFWWYREVTVVAALVEKTNPQAATTKVSERSGLSLSQ